MTDDVFEKIIEECSEHRIRRLIPYLNNEPLIDPKFMARLQFIRKKFPKTIIEISTNVELLTPEIAAELLEVGRLDLRLSIFGFYKETYNVLMEGLDYDRVYSNAEKLIEIHNKSKKRNTKIQVIMLNFKKMERKEFQEAKQYWDERKIEIQRFGLFNRADNFEDIYNEFDNYQYAKDIYGCKQYRPLAGICILYNGDILFCSNDWNREYVLGNIKEQSIYDIWNGDKYRTIREAIYKDKSSDEQFLCKRCNFATDKAEK